jgi:hypothetical protein
MLIKKYDLGNIQTFKIVVLGDFHLGDENSDIVLIKQTIDYIKKTPNCYVIINGDMLNIAIPGSKSDSVAETMTIEQEQDLAIELLYPIKDKIIVITNGNHEDRIYRLTGINPLRYVAKALGCLDKYTPGAYVLNLKTCHNSNPKHSIAYKVFGMHGAYGSSRKIGSIANALQDMSIVIPNANLYIRSHTHNQVSFSDDCLAFNDRGNLTRVRRTYYNANAFLKYGGYAESKGYRITDLLPSVINVRVEREVDKELVKDAVFFKTDIIKI